MHEQGRDLARLVTSVLFLLVLLIAVVYLVLSLDSGRQTTSTTATSDECEPIIEGAGFAREVVVLQADEDFTSVAVVVNDDQYSFIADQLKTTDNPYSMDPSMSATYCQVGQILKPGQRTEVNRLDHFAASRSRFYFTTVDPFGETGAD